MSDIQDPIIIPPISGIFTASPSKILSGEEITLTWKIQAANLFRITDIQTDEVLVNSENGAEFEGSIVVIPKARYSSYRLDSFNIDESLSAQWYTFVDIENIEGRGGPRSHISSFTATPSSVPSGGTVTLTYTVSDAPSPSIVTDRIAIFAGSVVVDERRTVETKTFTHNPTVDTEYRCRRQINNVTTDSISRNVTIEVEAPDAIINSFTASPSTIAPGESSTLSWSTTHATVVSIPGVLNPSTNVDGSISVSPTSTTVYTLRARNGNTGTLVTREVTVTVQGINLPTINSFTAFPSTIASGESSTLSWNTTGATSASINQGIGGVFVDGSESVSPSITTEYTLTATNSDGSVTRRVTVTVSLPDPDLPVIDNFSLSPSSIAVGESSTLSWSTTDAIGVTINQGIGAVSVDGSMSVSPISSTIYIITAFNLDGSVNQTITLVVGSTPVPPIPTLSTYEFLYFLWPFVAGRVITWSNWVSDVAGDNSRNNVLDRGLNSSQLATFRQAFIIWEAVVDVDFQEVTDGANVNLRLGVSQLVASQNLAAMFPIIDGTVIFKQSIALAGIHLDNPNPSTEIIRRVESLTTAMHEVGHALGLAHCEDFAQIMYGGGSAPWTQTALSAGDITGGQFLWGGPNQNPPADRSVIPTVTVHTNDQTIDSGASLQLNATVNDPQGLFSSYQWHGSGTFSDIYVEDPVWTAPFVDEETDFDLILIATPSGGGSGFGDFVTITVRAVVVSNVLPTVVIDTNPQTIDAGASLQLGATATDTDGTIASYAWTGAGTFSNPSIVDPTWIAPSPSTETPYTLTLRVTDNNGGEATATVIITVRAAVTPILSTNRLLIVDTSGDDELYEIDPDGVDTQGTRLRVLPSGLTVSQGMTVFNNRLLIADTAGDELYEIDPDGVDTQGTRLRALPSGLTIPEGMTVFNNRLLIVDDSGDELYEIDPDGVDTQGTRLRALPSGLTNPKGMTVFNNRLLIVDDSGDELYEIDPDGVDTQGTRLRALPSGLAIPEGMTVFNNRLLIVDNGGDELYEIDPDGIDTQGTRLRVLPSGLTNPKGMTVLVSTIDHIVDAGDVSWSFTTTQPTITHTAPTDHTVNAGDVSWLFVTTQPTVTHALPVPDQINDLTAMADGQTIIDLNWTAPDDRGVPITGYLIEVSEDGVVFTILEDEYR